MDVGLNDQAVFVNRNVEWPLMSLFHAGYSIGVFAGALMGAGMAVVLGLPTFLHFVIAAVIFSGAIFFSFPHL